MGEAALKEEIQDFPEQVQTEDPAKSADVSHKNNGKITAVNTSADNADKTVYDEHGRRHRQRTPEEKKNMIARLRRIEGQIRGLERMVDEDAYCPDILVQVSAATSALSSFSKVLLGCHIRGCVAEDIREGKDETIDELCNVLQKLMK